MRDKVPAFLLRTQGQMRQKASPGGKMRHGAIEKGLRAFSSLVVSMSRNDETVSRKGLFQALDARIKLLFLVFFVLIVSVKQTIPHEAMIALILFVLAVASRIPLGIFYSRIFIGTFFFGFLVAFPATVNVITPGKMLWPILTLDRSYDVWIYHIPREIGFSEPGVTALAMLCLRILNSLSVSFLVLYTTPLSQIVKALQVFRIPAAFILIVTLSVKYIVLFSRNVEDMYLARKSRSLAAESGASARMWVAGRMAYIFRKTERRSEEIYRAMVARGYSYAYRPPAFARVAAKDLLACGMFLLAGIIIWIW